MYRTSSPLPNASHEYHQRRYFSKPREVMAGYHDPELINLRLYRPQAPSSLMQFLAESVSFDHSIPGYGVYCNSPPLLPLLFPSSSSSPSPSLLSQSHSHPLSLSHSFHSATTSKSSHSSSLVCSRSRSPLLCSSAGPILNTVNPSNVKKVQVPLVAMAIEYCDKNKQEGGGQDDDEDEGQSVNEEEADDFDIDIECGSQSGCVHFVSDALSPPSPPSSLSSPLFPFGADMDESWAIAEEYFHLDEARRDLSLSLLSEHSLLSSDLSVELELTAVDTSSSSMGFYGLMGEKKRNEKKKKKVSNLNAVHLKEEQGTTSSSSSSSSKTTYTKTKPSKPTHTTTPPNSTLSDMIDSNRISSCARHENESRLLQQHLQNASTGQIDLVLDQILVEMVDLSCSDLANYVVQKVIEHGTRFQRDLICRRLADDISVLARDQFGCRVIQKALEYSELESKLLIFESLKCEIEGLVEDENGNHVVQKCVTELPCDDLSVLYDVMDGRIVHFCTSMYGCRVVQRLLANSTRSFRSGMISCILENGIMLSKDVWGNYVVQYMIENCKGHVSRQIVDVFLDHFEELSVHKLASNVIEKCLEFSRASELDLFVQVLLNRSNDELVKFMTHSYANYVVQTLIVRANFKHGGYKIHKRLKRYGLGQRIKAETAGRRVAAKLDEKWNEYQRMRNRNSNPGNASSSATAASSSNGRFPVRDRDRSSRPRYNSSSNNGSNNKRRNQNQNQNGSNGSNQVNSSFSSSSVSSSSSSRPSNDCTSGWSEKMKIIKGGDNGNGMNKSRYRSRFPRFPRFSRQGGAEQTKWRRGGGSHATVAAAGNRNRTN